jgi:hypothetical protein
MAMAVEEVNKRVTAFRGLYEQDRRVRVAMARDPAQTVFLYLAFLVDPDEVVFSEWGSDPAEQGNRSHVTGTVFLLTRDYAHVLRFVDIAISSERRAADTSSPGTITFAGHRLSTAQPLSMSLADPALDLIEVAAGSVRLGGEHWSVELPYQKRYGERTVDYFLRLRDLLEVPT